MTDMPPESFRHDSKIDSLRVPPQSVDSEQAVLGAMLNVKINAAGLKDRSVAEELIGEAERIAREAEKLEKEVLEIVHEKID